MVDEELLLGIDEDINEDDEFLEGLGRRHGVPMNSKMRGMFRKYANRQTNRRLAGALRSRGQRFLHLKKDRLSVDTRKAWKSGSLTFGEGVFYVRKLITGASSIVEIFQSGVNKDKEVGVTNIDKAKLPEFINLALSRMEINHVAATSGTTVKTAAYAPLTASSDDALLNGEIELKVDGKQLFKLPARQFVQPEADGHPANGYNLKAIKEIKEGEEIQINLHLAGTMSGTVDAIEFVMKGDITRTR